MKRDISPFNGLPTYADGTLIDLDRSTTTGADWNDFDSSVTDYMAEIEHRFDDGGHARVAARYSTRDVDFLYGWAGSAAAPNGDVAGMGWLGEHYEENSLALDAYVSKPFTLFGQEQNVLVGADYQSVDQTLYMQRGKIPGTFNIFDWNSNVPEPTVDYGSASASRTRTKPRQFGVYGQLRFKPIDRLTLIGGGRLSWYDTEKIDLASGITTDRDNIDSKFTPYAGVVFDLTDQLSAYASYTQIFQPQTESDAAGNIIDPREGRQYEVGLKGAFLGGSLNTSLAFFNLQDKNRAIAVSPGNYVAQGKVEVQGVEAEVSGEVLPGWQLQAGYTYSESEYLNGSTSGAVFSTYTPRHQLQLWSDYTFHGSDAWYDGLSVGAGVKAYSSFSSIAQGVEVKAPGYAVVNLRMGYQINDHLSANLNVNNVFDKKYYARVGSSSVFNFYGEPLNATFSLRATF
jgi:outer membrane receptor for ferric coprogen and ferric-rhodotorulic acid